MRSRFTAGCSWEQAPLTKNSRRTGDLSRQQPCAAGAAHPHDSSLNGANSLETALDRAEGSSASSGLLEGSSASRSKAAAYRILRELQMKQMLGINRRTPEPWAEWNMRSLRQAQAILARH